LRNGLSYILTCSAPKASGLLGNVNSISSLPGLLRIPNVIITALSVIVGSLQSPWDGSQTTWRILAAAISAGLIAAGGNAYNDYCDRDLDRLQKPERPLPSGRVQPGAAKIVATVCCVLGLVIGWILSPLMFIVATLAALLLVIYSRFLKGKPLWGNIAVAFVAGLAFIYGGAAVGNPVAALWAAWLAFLFHLSREIIKDLEDVPGDSAAGAMTLPVRYGLAWARFAATLALALLLSSLPLPYYLGRHNINYLWIALGGVMPVVLIVIILLWRWSKPGQFHRLSVWMKWDMLVGLVALLNRRV
jgi:geranylgeranylglycerol-phosphate geranylgeranyltransferase